MNHLELDITDLENLPGACKTLLEFAGDIKVFAFEAEMGAGKTTFIKQLCAELGSKDNFSSPTYSIVNEYLSPEGKIYHFDLYRIKNEEELLDIGFSEYIQSGHYCFIEWPLLSKPFLDLPYVAINLEQNQKKRYLSGRITR